jgi:nitrogen fixation protein NifU and related proteins
MDDLYQEIILEHYHQPQNFGEIDNPDKVISETNASCGDSFTFYIKLSDNKKIPELRSPAKGGAGEFRDLKSPGSSTPTIQNITFTGSGCAISTAACSILTEHLKGKPISEIEKLNLGSMQVLLGISVTPTRLKCLMLSARACTKLVDNSSQDS